MPTHAWYDNSPYPQDHAATKSQRRAVGTVKRVMDKPTDIRIFRNGSFLAEDQTVRIEGRGSTLNLGTRDLSNSDTFVRSITVFGVRDHPTLPDLDIQVGDRFGYASGNYVVTGITLHAGEIQAACERVQP